MPLNKETKPNREISFPNVYIYIYIYVCVCVCVCVCVLRKSDPTDKIRRVFFQAAAV